MSFAPQQNWELYRSLTDIHQREFLRNLSANQRFRLYAEMYQMVCGERRDGDQWRRLERRRWEQKLALRLRMVKAFAAMDGKKRG